MSENPIECEDVGDALRLGRDLRPARAYRILFAKDHLRFRPIDVEDPLPLGRQILLAAELSPERGYSLFALLANGDFEEVRLDEPFDLRGRGTEKFIAFLTDREYKLVVNEREVKWGHPSLDGEDLYFLARPGEDEAVFLRVPGGQDQLIELTDTLDLSQPGIEKFLTAPQPHVVYRIVVNGRPRDVNKKKVTFEQVVELAFPGCGTNEKFVFSMTYMRAASKPHDGSLAPGGWVLIEKEGTVFNVTKTVRS